jgi:hypothetical protein
LSGRITPFVIASRTSATDLPENSSRSAAAPAAEPARCPVPAALPARRRAGVDLVWLRDRDDEVVRRLVPPAREPEDRDDEPEERDDPEERDEPDDPDERELDERDDEERELDDREEDEPEEREPPDDREPPERDEPPDRDDDEREPDDELREPEPLERLPLEDPPLLPDSAMLFLLLPQGTTQCAADYFMPAIPATHA